MSRQVNVLARMLSILALLVGVSILHSEETEHLGYVLDGKIVAITWDRPPDDVTHMHRAVLLRKGADPKKIAEAVKKSPEGMAALRIWHWEGEIFNHPEDRVRTPEGELTDLRGPWFEHGIARMREQMDTFFSEFKEAGGRLDFFVMDNEGGLSNWHLGKKAKETVTKIVEDPRAEEFRNELAQYGLTEDRYDEVYNWRKKHFGYTLADNVAERLDRVRPGYLVWNAVVKKAYNEALNKGIAEVVLRYFPEAKISNYGSCELDVEHIVPDGNGHLQFGISHVGTHNSRSFYAGLGGLQRFKVAPEGRAYGNAPFDVLRFVVNKMRAVIRSSDAPMHPWISHKNFRQSVVRGNDYYQELVLHLALSGADDFLYWNPNPWRGVRAEDWRTDEHDRLVDELLGELNERFEGKRREPVLLQPIDWDSDLIVSGMQVGDGKVYYRVTMPPNTKHVRVRTPGSSRVLEAGDGRGVWYESAVGETPAFDLVKGASAATDLNPVEFQKVTDSDPVCLVQDGKPIATVAVMGNRNRQLQIAERELLECIEESTGADLPLVHDRIPDGPAIIIGDCDEAVTQGLRGMDLPPGGFAIKTAPGQRIFIVGNGNGTAWGVFELLERFVGVRWYWPKNYGGRSVPASSALIIDPVYLTDSPSFAMRRIWPPEWGSSAYYEGRQRLLEFQTKLRAGGSCKQRLVVHGDSAISKVEEYRNIDTMWQMTKDGKREFTHPCYSSEATVDAFMKEIHRHFDEDKKAHIGILGDTVTVSPADIGIACYCDRCREAWNTDVGRYGTASKIMSRFVARLGRRLEKDFPDKDILFLPYQDYTIPPDDVDFPDNVYIQMCHMPGLAMYKEPEVRERWQGYIDGWVALTGHPIQDWHYTFPADRTRAVYQYYHTVNDYYRRNRHKTVGTFINGLANHWPRFHPTMYCWLKSLWDPEFDVDAAVDQHCERMYGDASETIRKVLRITTDGWENTDWPGTSFSPKAMYETSYPKETIDRIRALLTEARRHVAGDDVAAHRVDYFAKPFALMFEEYGTVMEGRGKPTFTIQKVPENPTVDGKLDEDVWGKTTPVELVTQRNDREVETQYTTTVKAVFTLEGLTFGFHMEEPQPQKLATDLGSPDSGLLWSNDCVEIFLDPEKDGIPEFYQWIVSADLRLYDGVGRDYDWDADGVKTARQIGGDFWSLEVFIPFTVFENVERASAASEWSGQITRHRSNRNKEGADENQRLNYDSGARNSSRVDFCPIRFRE
ncbi:MAG: DUF4838 domain-containing protein [Candidatus Pacebacteria bacterium]|nr:DUF4838 domain-containing protein [Candidatus Paceibacterota bacterium]